MPTYAYTFTSGDTVTPTKLNNARTISDIVNADVKSDAAIAGTKIAPNFGGQNVVTTGTVTANAGSTFAGTTTTPALTIRQTGSGNALLVEDSATPDATPFVINASGQVIMGHTDAFTTRLSTANVTPSLQQIGNAAGLSSNLNARFSDDSAAGAVYFAKSRGAMGQHTIVNAGDQMGNVSFGGSDGTKIVEAARITGAVDGTPGTDDMPGRITFSTTADGGSTVTERMRLTSGGTLAINSVSPPAGSALHVAGKVTATTFGDVTSDSGFVGAVADGSAIVRSSRASTDVNGPQIDLRKARGTQAAKTVVDSGDIIGEVRFLAYDGANDREAARIRSTVDGSPGAADMPGTLQFYTTEDGASGVTERMRIDNAGRVSVGATSPEPSAQMSVTSTVRGFLPPRMTGVQRDAIAAPVAGLMIYNTTTNKLNFHNGTAWEAVTSS